MLMLPRALSGPQCISRTYIPKGAPDMATEEATKPDTAPAPSPRGSEAGRLNLARRGEHCMRRKQATMAQIMSSRTCTGAILSMATPAIEPGTIPASRGRTSGQTMKRL